MRGRDIPASLNDRRRRATIDGVRSFHPAFGEPDRRAIPSAFAGAISENPIALLENGRFSND